MKKDDINSLVDTYRKEKAEEEDSDDEYDTMENTIVNTLIGSEEPGIFLFKGSDVRRVKMTEASMRGFNITPQAAVTIPSNAQHTATAQCKRWLVCAVDDFFRGVEVEVTSAKGMIHARAIGARFAPGFHKFRGNLAEEANSIYFGPGMHEAPVAGNSNGGDKLKRSVGCSHVAWTKEIAKPFVEWPSFNMLVGVVIAANALTIGLETDARAGSSSEELSLFWFFLEIIFCTTFLIELTLRLSFHGWKFFATPMPRPMAEIKNPSEAEGEEDTNPGPPARTSGTWRMWINTIPMRIKLWNVVDFTIVVISILDVVFTLVGSGANARFVSMLRFVRLLRLVRLVRLFRIFKELWLVANGLINSMKTLLWVCIMILIVCYIGGIYATLQIGHNDELYNKYFRETGWDHETYFATVPRSLFTLFQVVTLDQWAESIARHVVKNQPGMLIFFVVLISIVTFGLLNIIVGVVVENALSTAAKDQTRMKKAKDRDRQLVFNQLREIFEDADTDGSGYLTFDEVQKAIQQPEICNKLRMIDFPVDEPHQVFQLLDYDDSGELTIDEFITGCLRMKGTAKSKDLLVAQVALDCMKKHYNTFEEELESLQLKLHRLDATARAITDHGERVFLDMRQYRHRHKDDAKLATGHEIPRMSSATMNRAPWEQADADRNDQEALARYKSEPASEGPRAAGFGGPQGALTNGKAPPPPPALTGGVQRTVSYAMNVGPSEPFGHQIEDQPQGEFIEGQIVEAYEGGQMLGLNVPEDDFRR